MTTACDDGTERIGLDLGPGADPLVTGDGSTVLLSDDVPGDGALWTLRRECDVHGALVRGLADYIGTLRIAHVGRLVQLGRVTQDYATTSDENVDGPVAAVYGEVTDGMYASPPMSPTKIKADPTTIGLYAGEAAPYLHWLYETATYRHGALIVRVWCDDKPSRTAAVMGIEDLAWPSRGIGGFRLRLDHYHGAVGRFALVSQIREGETQDIITGRWIATFKFAATAPLVRVHRLPRASVRGAGTVT